LPKAYSNLLPEKRPETAADPVAEAEAALKKLRRDPSDKEATEALERALQRLKVKAKERGAGTPYPR
jgi:hypothetical protein